MGRKRKPLDSETETRYLKRVATSADTLLRIALGWKPNPKFQTLYSDPLPVPRDQVIESLRRWSNPDQADPDSNSNLHGHAEPSVDPRQHNDECND